MPEPEHTITNCGSCGNAMDVTAVAPFSNVECPTCGAKSRVKTEFGHYTLLRRLAEGGMSLVFVAMDNTLGREVALKILNEDYSSDERRIAAFEEEARITASFSHPHVVRVFTTGRAFGRFYIAMELVPGGHFEHQIRERTKIPEEEILPFAIQVAEGLEAARAAGLIHRDIKPGNILLDAQGSAKIVDFGLALVTKGGSATAQEIWATPYYVPPETIEGHPEDFRSDLYAFGATLYHALSGKPSCDEESMATDKLRLAKKHVKSLRSAAPDVSDDTCSIVDTAMAYNRDARFSSYEEMISRLKTAQSRLKKGKGRGLASGKESRKKEWIALGAASALVIGAIAAGIVWIARDDKVKPESQPVALASTEAAENSGASGGQIGQRYRDAREALASGKFEKASYGFASLRDDPAVQEPTRSWVAVEVVLATMLEGRSTQAKVEAKAAAAHIQKTDLANQRDGQRLLHALGKLDGLEPMEPASESSANDASWALAMMLGGLKNWEQGLIDHSADSFFDPLVSAQFKEKEQWVRTYQKIAADYLEDQRLLANLVFASIPPDKAGCQSAINECERLIPQLKTHGRAHFNITAFQHELKQQMLLLSTNPVAVVNAPASVPIDPVPAPDPLIRFHELTKACLFTEAASFIQSLPGDPVGAKSSSLLEMNEFAQIFLNFLEQEIRTDQAPVSLRLRDGNELLQVKMESAGHLAGKLATGGEERGVNWGEVDPESAIQYYRTAFTRSRGLTAQVLQPRHETAIAFDWLVGDRARAGAAAERLALEDEAFKVRWEVLLQGLPAK